MYLGENNNNSNYNRNSVTVCDCRIYRRVSNYVSRHIPATIANLLKVGCMSDNVKTLANHVHVQGDRIY